MVGTTDNRRCIAYYDATDMGLKIAKTSNGTTWFTETVDTIADVGSHCSITYNTSGDFFMAYADTSSSDVKRAFATNVSMSAPTTWTIGSTAYSDAVTYTGIALNGTTASSVSGVSPRFARWSQPIPLPQSAASQQSTPPG